MANITTSLLRKGAKAVLPSGSIVLVRSMGADTVALSYLHPSGTSTAVDVTVARDWFQKYARAA